MLTVLPFVLSGSALERWLPPVSDAAPSYVCYWAVPAVLLAGASLASHAVGGRTIAAANSPDIVRRTFVAFRELALDELYHLAQQKAEREVGTGMEAYAVQVGSAGVPLTGDESRESWPTTYKVRERR